MCHSKRFTRISFLLFVLSLVGCKKLESNWVSNPELAESEFKGKSKIAPKEKQVTLSLKNFKLGKNATPSNLKIYIMPVLCLSHVRTSANQIARKIRTTGNCQKVTATPTSRTIHLSSNNQDINDLFKIDREKILAQANSLAKKEQRKRRVGKRNYLRFALLVSTRVGFWGKENSAAIVVPIGVLENNISSQFKTRFTWWVSRSHVESSDLQGTLKVTGF